MKNKNNILKGIGVLLITALMFLPTISVTANTNETIENVLQISNVEKPMPTSLDTFSEGFEDGIIPEGWLNVDDDADGFYWEIMGSNFAPHSGDYCAASASFFNVPITPDNWLITPAIPISSIGELLTYWIAAYDHHYTDEHLEVWISTTGTNISDFTDEVDNFTTSSNVWVERSIDLSSYYGETIYIAFRHCESTNMWWIKIDDIEILVPTIPDLDCDGSLSWTDIAPNGTVEGNFTVENIGEPTSILSWEISEYPEWGEWTFTPSSGSGLTPEDDPVIVHVEVVAPDEEETEFTGEITIVNIEDSQDSCTIQVSLATPMNQNSLILQFLEILFEHSPWAFPILRYMFGL